MSLFGKILNKLGLGKKPAETSTAATATAAPPKSAMAEKSTVTAPPKPAPVSKPAAPAPSPAAAPKPAVVGVEPTEPAAAPKPAPISEVDVVTKLEGLAKGTGLNWKVSIVDLLKLLDLDSSKDARVELAKELGCPAEFIGGDYSKMNVWLHKEVLRKIAENGGNIPKELLD